MSRIHAALQYKKPAIHKRRTTWDNFVCHLESVDNQGTDIRHLREHTNELAKYELAGRQIRNALSTASRLALFDATKFSIKQMRTLIETLILSWNHAG